ncbi:MAG: circularly permuted type 2 ATP-grasp protein [Hahellaceae bacterium]|nr:circularly permuted type 2 ATP-grasp protein [Hahellaceae bacterium]
MGIDWKNYKYPELYDELITDKGKPRKVAQALAKQLAKYGDEELERLKATAELAIKEMGISFTVYDQEGGSIDRQWPFDIIPRVISKKEWDVVEEGLKQRVKALNAFISDLYGEQKIIKDGVFPAEVIKNSKNFRPQCVGMKPAFGVWAHICGSDLVRHSDGQIYVLEDNLRVPSGVSYLLENRQVMKRVFADLFGDFSITPVDDYSSQLFDMLCALSPRKIALPQVVVLTPGIYNSAYFEHAYLAQQMGCELVEGTDLVVSDDDCVYMKTIYGLERVDVIYRRVDDMFLDPEVFNSSSVLGVRGLMRAWLKGNVALANAPGAGVADDKVVYAFVPDMIKYYLGEEAILPNVPTYLCMKPDDCAYVLEHLEELVVKPANESGGYGMLVGPKSTRKEREKFAELIKADPRNYIAQPTLNLSTVPTLIDGEVEPRHVDMRPFILSGEQIYVTTGGLTRVALKKGSLVVNSSQGGGSKDTWIIDEDA